MRKRYVRRLVLMTEGNDNDKNKEYIYIYIYIYQRSNKATQSCNQIEAFDDQAPKYYTKPRQTIQSPDRVYKDMKYYSSRQNPDRQYKAPTKLYKDTKDYTET